MIVYPDGPCISFVNSILEKDIIKRIPADYSLNLLISRKQKLEGYNKFKINNKNLNNIQRDLINLLNYDDQNFFQDKTEEEDNNNLNEGELINNKYQGDNSNISEKPDLIEENQNKEMEPIIKANSDSHEEEESQDSINNELLSNKAVQQNENMVDINNSKQNTKNNDNFKCNINQNIYNNFNIPYINFIYNIGTNGMNNNLMNDNINNSDNNNSMNLNNFNNNIINNNMVQNIENPTNNINNYYNISFDINNSRNEPYNYNNKDLDVFKNNMNMNDINNRTNNYNNYFVNNNNFINKKNLNKHNNAKEIKYMNMTLEELANKLDLIATKKHGCKFLENYLKSSENQTYIINNIFYPKLYWVKLYELCNDLFGNYFIQALIPELDNNNIISFTNLVTNNLLNLCLNQHGTRVVQILINNIKDNKFGLLLLFTKALSKIMDKLLNNLNGSFVIMHYAATIKDNDFIYDFLNNNLVFIATNSYSCSALQKLIDISTNQQKQKLLINIINNTDNLVGNQCGLYVLQFIMNKKNYYINDAILDKIINKIIYLSKRKYSSNVIEKCLETCSPEKVNKLINILNKEIIIRDLIKDNFGNYVIQKLLIVCTNDEIKQKILGYIALEFNNLKSLPFGQKLMNKIIMAYPQIKHNF